MRDGHPAERPDFTFEVIRLPDRHSTFRARLLHADDRLIVLRHQIFPSRPLASDGEVVMDSGYDAIWFLFKGEPYDIGRFYRPDGCWTGMYVDVLEPVRWHQADPTTLEPLVDLFLDFWIAPDRQYRLLDEDEFAAAQAAGTLSGAQARAALATAERVRMGIEAGAFPPADVWVERWSAGT